MNLNEAVEQIDSRKQLANFIRALAKDRAENPARWENADLESYLEAAASWIDDMDGYFENVGQQIPENPNWRTLGADSSSR